LVSRKSKQRRSLSVTTPLAFSRETIECVGSGGSTIARLKLEGIDGRAPPGVEPAA